MVDFILKLVKDGTFKSFQIWQIKYTNKFYAKERVI